jgi:serine protease AprX
MSRLRPGLRLALATGAICLSALHPSQTAAQTFAACKSQKCSTDLSYPSAAVVPVIVQYRNAPTELDDAKIFDAGGQITAKHPHIRGISAAVPASSLTSLANDPNVAYVSLDRPIGARGPAGPVPPAPPTPTTPPAAPTPPAGPVASIALSANYTVEPINAPAVWARGYLGLGIGVAVIDSGVSNEPDLLGHIVYSQSFLATQSNDSNDHYGHGTHVAGLIAGDGLKSFGNQYFRTFTGVAPFANIINLRVLDENGNGTDSQVIQAIETAIWLKNRYNIRVINLSLGRPIFESYQLDPLCQAVEQAWKAGIVVVVAAGNQGRNLALNGEGYGTIEAPGNDPYALTVGASNSNYTASLSDDVMATYSSKGPSYIDQIAKPDIIAPGNLVTSLLSGGSTLQQEYPTFYTPMSFYQTGAKPKAVSNDYTPLS